MSLSDDESEIERLRQKYGDKSVSGESVLSSDDSFSQANEQKKNKEQYQHEKNAFSTSSDEENIQHLKPKFVQNDHQKNQNDLSPEKILEQN